MLLLIRSSHSRGYFPHLCIFKRPQGSSLLVFRKASVWTASTQKQLHFELALGRNSMQVLPVLKLLPTHTLAHVQWCHDNNTCTCAKCPPNGREQLCLKLCATFGRERDGGLYLPVPDQCEGEKGLSRCATRLHEGPVTCRSPHWTRELGHHLQGRREDNYARGK